MKNAHPDDYITCDQCLKQVKAHYLRKHFYMRHRKGVYKCSQDCDYIAEYYHELEKHRYMVHNSRQYGIWADGSGGSAGLGGGGSGGGFGPSSSSNPSTSSSGNVFFPSNPIAAAIVNHQANNKFGTNPIQASIIYKVMGGGLKLLAIISFQVRSVTADKVSA